MEVYPKKPIKISSKAEMDYEMRRIHSLFKSKETDETWEHFNSALANIKRWIEEDKVHEYDGFTKHIKQLHDGINRTLLSERTRLAGTAIELLKALASNMGRPYEPLHDLFHASFVRMFAKTKKVTVHQSTECMKTIIESAKIPRYIPRFAAIITDQKIQHNNSTLASAATCLEKAIQVNAIEVIQTHLQAVEASIRIGITKPAVEVRAGLRACYKTYQKRMPTEAARFEAGLTDQAKKYLKAQATPASTILKRRNSSSSSSSSSSSVISRSSLTTSRGRASLPSVQPAPARSVTSRHSAPHTSLNLPARPTLQSSNNCNRPKTTAKIVKSKPALTTTAVAGITKRRSGLPVLSSKKIVGPARLAIAGPVASAAYVARGQQSAAPQISESNNNRSLIKSAIASPEQQPHSSSNESIPSPVSCRPISAATPQSISNSCNKKSPTEPATTSCEQQHPPSDDSTAEGTSAPIARPDKPVASLNISSRSPTKTETASPEQQHPAFTGSAPVAANERPSPPAAATSASADSTPPRTNPEPYYAQSTASANHLCPSSAVSSIDSRSPSMRPHVPRRPRSALLDLKSPYKFATDNRRHIPISKPLTLSGTPARPVKRKRPTTTDHGEENARPTRRPNLQS